MTWLNEIEEYVSKNRELLEGLLDENDMMRMARVIREQSEYINQVDDMFENVLEGSKKGASKFSNRLLNAIQSGLREMKDNLSPDAKEVIDGLAE